jgi:hypothetical protein
VLCLRIAAMGGVVELGFIARLIWGQSSAATTIGTILMLAVMLYYTGRTLWVVRVSGRHIHRGDPDPGDYAALSSQLRQERWRRRRSS